MVQIGIFVGTVHGNALLTAEEVASTLKKQNHQVKLFEDGSFKEWLKYVNHVILIITSTTGNGNLPNNILPLFQKVKDNINDQSTLRYGIIALGDRSYDTFCKAGYIFDIMLQERHAKRVGSILKIDALQHPRSEILACSWALEWSMLL